MRSGATRIVILIGNYAIKIPNVQEWRLFLHGLLANMQEATWSGYNDFLCPVLFHVWGGFLVIMPRVKIEKGLELIDSDFQSLCINEDYILPVENKAGHFGWLGKRLVAVDYGS